MRSLNLPGTSKQLALLAVLVLAVTAGCLGGGDNGDDGTELNQSTDDIDDPADGNGADGSADNDAGSADIAPDIGNLERGETPTSDELEPVEADVTGDDLLTESISELEAIQRYQYRTVRLQRQEANSKGGQFTRQVTINKANQQLDYYRSVGSNETRTFLVDGNGVSYVRDDQLAQQLDSRWIRQKATQETSDRLLSQYNLASEVATIFRNATATLEGQGTYRGESVYVLTADVDEVAIERYYAGTSNNFNFTSIHLTTWISTESNLPLRYEQVTNSTGPTGVKTTAIDLTEMAYSPPEITLPDAARDAPSQAELREQDSN